MSEKNKGALLIITATLLWSTGGVLMKVIPWNPLMINGMRSLIAFVFICILNRQIKIKINRYIVLTAICMSMTTTLFATANKLTTAANSIVLQNLSPVFILIITCFMNRRLPSLKQAAVVITAFAGMVLFFIDKIEGGYLLGNIVAVMSGVTYAGVFIFNSRPQSSNDDALRLGCLISFCIFAVTIPFNDYTIPPLDVTVVFAIIALGVVQIGLAYYSFGRGLKRIGPVSASLLGLFEALFNPLWVAIIVGEMPGMYAMIGGVVIIAAVAYNIAFVTDNDQPSEKAVKKKKTAASTVK